MAPRQPVTLLRQIAELNLAKVRTVVVDYYSNMDAREPVTNDELCFGSRVARQRCTMSGPGPSSMPVTSPAP